MRASHVLLCLLAIVFPARADEGGLLSFDYPLEGVTDTEATAITPSGVIVGRYLTADGNQHGFMLAHGEFTTIDLNGPNSHTDAAWINASGKIAGDYNAGGVTHAYVLSPTGGFTVIDYPGAVVTTGWGINDSGEVTGTEDSGDFFSAHGYVFSHGTFTSFDFPGARATWATMLNERDEIVGTYFGQDFRFHGFLRSGGVFSTVDFPKNSTFTWITGINTAGDIVGFYNDAAGMQHGFVLCQGTFIPIDVPGATATEAGGIDAQDNVVGRYVTPDGHTHAYFMPSLR